MDKEREIDFTTIKEAENKENSPVPEGQYLVSISEIKTNDKNGSPLVTTKGDEYWLLHLNIEHPAELKGRLIFDRIFFSEAALERVKMVSKRCGVDVTKKYKLTDLYFELKDKLVYVDVKIVKYLNKQGQQRERNEIPFGGYHAIDDVEGKTFEKAVKDLPSDPSETLSF